MREGRRREDGCESGSAVLTLKCVVTRGGATPGVVVMYSLPSLDTLSEVITETYRQTAHIHNDTARHAPYF